MPELSCSCNAGLAMLEKGDGRDLMDKMPR